uniref:Helicase ATP-binding domain-containing protein n=1 Tax=viral metagenome TaxID=1070528 RepID=A0A6C0CIK4_9ZZZZ
MEDPLAVLAAVYPDEDDEDYISVMAGKKEFVGPEYVPKFGDPRSYQRNMFRLLGSQSGPQSMMIVWPTGKGKARLPTDLIRMIADFPLRYGNETNKGKCIIAVKASVIGQWQNELSKYAEFTTEKLRDETTLYQIRGRRHALATAIKRVVELKKLDQFARELSGMSADQIRRQFSVDIVCIDEAHVLRNEGVDFEELSEDAQISPKDKNYVSKITYQQTRRLAKYANIGLRLSMTATPMYNSALELVSVLSFTQPENKQLSVAELEVAIEGGKEALKAYLEPKLRGHLSYLSDVSDLAPVYDQGQPFWRNVNGTDEKSTLKIVEVRMLPEQDEVYQEILDRKEPLREGVKKRTGEKFHSRTRQCLNFIYINPEEPEKNTYDGFEYFRDPLKPSADKNGYVIVDPPIQAYVKEGYKEGMGKVLNKNGKKVGEPRRENLEPHRFTFRFEDELFAGCPPRNPDLKQFGKGSELDRKRLAVIRRMSAKYARVIEIVHTDMMFPHEGEMAFYFHSWVLNGGCIPLAMCFDAMGYERFLGEHNDAELLDDRPRYALMTGEPGSTTSRNRNIKDVANHPANAFGNKIMIIIASDVLSMGTSLTNGRKFIMGGPNYSLTTQPEGRINRADSHRAFKDAKQRFVRRYLMAALRSNGEQTVDHDIWWQVQQKDMSIQPVREVLAEISVDAGLNSKEVRKMMRTEIKDVSTYHLHWAGREFAFIEDRIRKAFSIKTNWSLSELSVLLEAEHDVRTVVWCLTNMLERRDIINDRFGFPHVLREHGGSYYLGSFMEDGRLEEEYSKITHIPFPKEFNAVTAEVFEKVASSEEDISLKQFVANWEGSSAETGANHLFYLERALAGLVREQEIANFILTDLAVVWFKTPEYIFHYLEEMRPKGNGGGYQYNREKLDAKKGKIAIRILEKDSSEFRNANPAETDKCVRIVNDRWFKRAKSIRERSGLDYQMIYNVSSDRKFRFKILTEEEKNGGRPGDGRSNRGLEASSQKPPGLAAFLWEAKIANPDGPDQNRLPKKVDALRKDLGELGFKDVPKDWDVERLQFYYSWFSGGTQGRAARMVKALKTHFLQNDWLFVK